MTGTVHAHAYTYEHPPIPPVPSSQSHIRITYMHTLTTHLEFNILACCVCVCETCCERKCETCFVRPQLSRKSFPLPSSLPHAHVYRHTHKHSLYYQAVPVGFILRPVIISPIERGESRGEGESRNRGLSACEEPF